ncbi:glycine cleavage system protein GcvH [Nonomuraea sp. NPDC004297]
MSSVPEELRYTRQHQWVSGGLEDGDRVLVGLTDHAQQLLSDVVFVQPPERCATVGAGDAVGQVESLKVVSDFYSPVGGEIIAVNDELTDMPELVNNDPYGEGWLFEVRVHGGAVELMSAAEYTALISGSDS